MHARAGNNKDGKREKEWGGVNDRKREGKEKRGQEREPITSGHMEIIAMPAAAFLGNATVSPHI